MIMRKCWWWLVVLLVALSVHAVANTTMVTVSINDDAPYTVAREVNIHLVYTGTGAPTQMRIYATGEGDWSDWFEYTDRLDWVLTNDDGLKIINVETRYWLESSTDTTVYGAWRVVAGEDAIFLDQTPPVLTFSVTPDVNESGWYTGPVSVAFQASDAGSGLVTSPRDLRFNQEGAGQSLVRKAVDKAGNETEVTVSGINIDMTPPVLTFSVSPDANENGWHNGPVTVAFQASDTGSGLTTSNGDLTFGLEGAGQSFVGKAIDKAGNETEVTVSGINIDMTPPVLTFSLTPDANENGWYNGPVSVVFQASDAGSGVASTLPNDLTLDQEGAGQSVAGKAIDKAGNEAEITVTGINIDLTPPSLTISVSPYPNENGWFDGPVTVGYNVTDRLSGLASVPDDRAFTITSSVTLFPKATDKAGNVAELPSVAVNIDIDDPSIVITGVDPGALPNVWTPGPSTVTVSGDGFSGVASIEYIEGAEVLASDGGEQTVTAQVTSLAGNTSEISVSHINIDSTLSTTTVLLVGSEGVSGANVHDPVSATIDLKARLDAFGIYDSDDVALGYAFEDAAGTPIAGLKVHATILEVGAIGTANVLQSLHLCEFAPTGGFYYFVLPAELVSGQVYEVWFEEATEVHMFKTELTVP